VGHASMMALLVAAPYPEGGRLSRGEDNGDRGARLDWVWSCAARGSWARTGSVEQDIGKATSGSSGEAAKKKMAKLETTSTGGTGGSSDGSSNGDASSAGGQRGPRGQARLGLVLRGSGQLGPNGLSGAGHKRRRQGANDIGKATSGSSGEAEKTKMAKLEATSAGDTTARREVKDDSSSEEQWKWRYRRQLRWQQQWRYEQCRTGQGDWRGGGKEGVLT
jgi:hypothetical protein